MARSVPMFRSVEEMRSVFPDGYIEAWGDESVRMTADPPIYLLGATIFLGDPRYLLSELEKLKPKDAKKLHWRDLGTRSQKKSLEIIANIMNTTTIVVASPLVGNKQERARRKCLQELLTILEDKKVNCLCLESRNSIADKRDVDFLHYLQRAKIVSDIEVRHIVGRDEIRTCIPDQILGAYVETRVTPNAAIKWTTSWNRIREGITVSEIPL